MRWTSRTGIFPTDAFCLTCWRPTGRRRAAVHRAQRRRPCGRNHASRNGRTSRAGCAWSTPRRSRTAAPTSRARPAMRRHARCRPSRAGHDGGTALRAAAHGATASPSVCGRRPRARSTLLLDRPVAMTPMPANGSRRRCRRPAPARATASASTTKWKLPDPASHFQPQDVHGPSEVIDHAAYSMAGARLARTALGAQRLS